MRPGSEGQVAGAAEGTTRVRRNLRADVATLIVAQCLERLGADAGFVATVGDDPATLEVARVTPYSERPVHLEFSLDAPYPLAEAVRTRLPLFIADNEQLACDHPGLVRVQNEDHACATLPLIGPDGELLGALNLGFDDPHEFTEEERERIDVLGRHCAQAIALAGNLEGELTRPTSRR